MLFLNSSINKVYVYVCVRLLSLLSCYSIINTKIIIIIIIIIMMMMMMMMMMITIILIITIIYDDGV